MTGLYYPIALKLKDRVVVIAGGGRVAERKVKTLLRFGARVRVISPDLTKPLQGLTKSRRISWLGRAVKASDIAGADLAIAATSDTAVNKKVSEWARKQDVPVNVADGASMSSFISPATLRAFKAVVAVYTHGRDPALSMDLKNFLKENRDLFLSYRDRSQKRRRREKRRSKRCGFRRRR